MAKKATIETTQLKPSECVLAIKATMNTNRAMFMWGAPGISKSQISAGIATSKDIAFIDLRLSQLEPTDLRGVPYPNVVCGKHGVSWATPHDMPQDLNLSWVEDILPEETIIRFYNPKGKNGIHYCTNPKITVNAIGHGKAKVISHDLDSMVVALYDEKGALTEGKIRINVTGETKAILALEEFNSASPSVQAASYELVLDRRLGSYIVPDGVFIMGMGNRDTDKGLTYKMPTPVMNRFIHIEMKHDFDDWQEWAIKNFINSDVVGYLTAFPSQLFDFDPTSASRGFATPRSWEFVSDILNNNEDMGYVTTVALLSGCVGEAIAVQFATVRSSYKNLPKVNDILSGKLSKMPDGKTVEVALSYMIVTNLCYELKNRANEMEKKHGKNYENSADYTKWLEQADNFLDFMLNNFQHEICVMGAKSAISIHELPFKVSRMKKFKEFSAKFRDLLLAKN